MIRVMFLKDPSHYGEEMQGGRSKARTGRRLLVGCRRNDGDREPRHRVGEVERGRSDLQELVMDWRQGTQESREQEESRGLAVPVTAAETRRGALEERRVCSCGRRR